MTSPHHFSGNIERFSGFADLYDRHRPKPPTIMATLLTQLAQTPRPTRVIDLGSGTGLSTRYWADKAEEVIGIEPTADMRHQAEAETAAKNISYREGFSHQTGLPDHCADIVTCSQALHWMEPQATFDEAGGVFAAFDYDWPPTTSNWEADAAYETCTAQVNAIEIEFTPKQASHERIKRWGKDKHLERMQVSGCFRYTKEVVVHHNEQGNAERLIGLLLSQGSVMTLLKNGYSEDQLGLTVFRERVQRALGAEPKTWHWSSRVRYGIT